MIEILKINKLYNLDCREGLKQLEDESIDCCISSPPYWSLRDYGIEPSIWDSDANCEHEWKKFIKKGISGGKKSEKVKIKDKINFQITPDSDYSFCSKCGAWRGTLGLEPNFELYIKHVCGIYDLVKQKLKKSGTCWVNLGDTYGGSGNSSGHTSETKNLTRKTSEYGASKGNQKSTRKYAKCLLMLPQRFAIEMINRGWILRNVIIWHKPNSMPSSARDRFTVDFEYVYFFVKSNKNQYWINEKTRKSTSTKPLGTKGIEGIDWEWRKCEKCLGTGIKHQKCKFCVETGWYYDESLRPRKCPKCRGLGRIKQDKECESCKGKGVKKYNFWKGKQYFFEQQREKLSQNPATQERYKHKVGNQTNRKDNGVEMVKPGKAFSKNFPQPLEKIRGYKDKPNNEENPQHHGQDIPTYKGGKNKRTVWKISTKANPEAHFATFPSALVKPMILSGCPKFICKECGKPRERIIETINIDYDSNLKYNCKNKYGQTLQGFQRNDSIVKQREYSRIEAKKLFSNNIKKQKEHIKQVHDNNTGKPKILKGYSDCGCKAGFIPSIVLDPFTGTGTTLYEAWKLGRNYIGFEISKEYCKIANKGLSETKTIRLDKFIKEKIEV